MRGRRGWGGLMLCAGLSVLGVGCAAQQSARPVDIRAVAERRLAGCLGWNVGARPTGPQRTACQSESEAFCRQRGLEAGCGAGGLWTRDFSRSR
jgi:hypothetical protein